MSLEIFLYVMLLLCLAIEKVDLGLNGDFRRQLDTLENDFISASLSNHSGKLRFKHIFLNHAMCACRTHALYHVTQFNSVLDGRISSNWSQISQSTLNYLEALLS